MLRTFQRGADKAKPLSIGIQRGTSSHSKLTAYELSQATPTIVLSFSFLGSHILRMPSKASALLVQGSCDADYRAHDRGNLYRHTALPRLLDCAIRQGLK